jgi:hypothetical protein
LERGDKYKLIIENHDKPTKNSSNHIKTTGDMDEMNGNDENDKSPSEVDAVS